MKTIKNILIVLCVILSMTSCLHAGLDDIEEYKGNDITAVSRVEYRYISDEISPASGQDLVKNVTLGYSGCVIDTKSAIVDIPITVPSNFPESELPNLSASELVVVVTISTAARIEPIGNAPALGVPGDWSKPNQYKVTAADGSSKNWTITINGLDQ